MLRRCCGWPDSRRLPRLSVSPSVSQAGLWVAVIGLAALLLIHLRYAALLAAWLEQPRLEDVPDGWGIWTDVFARLYRTRRSTEQNEHRLLENEERFRRTISALPEGIVLIDATLQIDWCNPVAEQHLGISLRADQGLRVTNLVRDPEFVELHDLGALRSGADISTDVAARALRSKCALSNSSPRARS